MLGDITREATMLQRLILKESTRSQVSCIVFFDTASVSSMALRSTEAGTNARTGADADIGTDTCADTGCPRKNTLINFWTRDHALHLLADIVVRTLQQLHEMGHSASVHHSLQDYYVCEQVKSMISSPKIL